ncbi:MAG: DUF3179 domain-containing protein [Balneolaceae bacterium]|nr:MAG: DUF3179 domain-containing protein [Balneolaceae bacterium]
MDLDMELLNNISPGKIFPIVTILALGFAASCGLSDSGTDRNGFSPPDQQDWLIPLSEIVDGGPGKDGIPSIDQPDFAPANEITYVPDNRMVIGVHIDGVTRAYPHQILDWHEIVNDQFGSFDVAVIYCPLTGTGMCWTRTIDGQTTEFGVSGLLFRNNLIAYDRNTDSNWSQMQLRSVNGAHIGRDIETFQVVETTWATWKAMYPQSLVHTTNTGFQRNYSGFTYGSDFSTNHNRILFPIQNSDNRLQNKDRVHGILGSRTRNEPPSVRVYALRDFGDGVALVRDTFDSEDYLIVGSTEHDFAAAFRLDDGNGVGNLEFEAVQESLPVVMQDSEGNKWDVFGRAVEGPRSGTRLPAARSYTGYWYAWADFFPDLQLFEHD